MFRGYQTQPQGPTVQDTLATAMRAAGFLRAPVAAGRTDLGVHARMQVVSFRVPTTVPAAEVAQRVNAQLPLGVGLCVSRQAPAKFHAQWAATAKEYRYRVVIGEARPEWSPFAWRVEQLEVPRVRALLQRCVGTRDFVAFHLNSSPRRPRTVASAEVVALDDGLCELRLVGDGFARHQVRYLVGGAVQAARGEIAEDDFLRGLSEARAFAGHRAPAHGLILWEVRYPGPMDPFTGDDRAEPPGLPSGPPFFT